MIYSISLCEGGHQTHVCGKSPDTHEKGPNNTCNTDPSFFISKLGYSSNDDGVDQQYDSQHKTGNLSGLGWRREEQEHRQEKAEGQSRERKIKETRSPGVHARGADEDGNQQQHPPEEGDYCEEDSEVAGESHAGQVVWRDLKCHQHFRRAGMFLAFYMSTYCWIIRRKVTIVDGRRWVVEQTSSFVSIMGGTWMA